MGEIRLSKKKGIFLWVAVRRIRDFWGSILGQRGLHVRKYWSACLWTLPNRSQVGLSLSSDVLNKPQGSK